jgi:hypothetical protein
MSLSQPALNLVCGMAALAVAVVGARAAAADAEGKRSDALAPVAKLAVFFGHQSVGDNLVAGLQRVAARDGGALQVVAAGAGPARPATFSHALIGANGDPELKMRAFAEAVDGGPGRGAQVALMKLCYVDFDGPVDPAALFARYQATLAGLRARHPGTVFVHVTTPLTAVQTGWKPLVKRLIGRESSESRNARRERYNALMRGAYAGKEPLFDLAAVESTRPDGSRETVTWSGQAVPMLVPAYTDDGGHLNAVGQERAAAALLQLLGSLPTAPAGAAP